MELTDLLSELTKPMLPTVALIISFLCIVISWAVAIIAEKLNHTKIANVSIGLVITAAIVTVAIVISLPSKPKLDYDLSRDKNYVYVNSHNDRLNSAKLKIIGEDEQTVYVLHKNETYKIPIMSTSGRKEPHGITSKPI